MNRFGQELEKKEGYKIMYTFSEQVLAYSYAVTNLLNRPVDITLDFMKSEKMLFSSQVGILTKRVEA